ncbi:Rs1, partial [Symbiodinium natans]
LVDGADISIADPKHAGGDQRLVINTGQHHEYSDWAVMELMTWNYGLSLEEMKEAAEYLSKKVGAGQPDGCIYEVVNVEEVDRMYSGTGEWNADKSMLDNEVGGFCTPQRHCCEALDDWMQMDLKVSRPVAGVVIQGKYPHNGVQDWVWSFKVQYKEDVASAWNTIDALFTGIASPDEKNRVFFTSPVKARFIRLTHFFFKQWACMRAAVIVCNSQAPNEMMLVEESTCSTTFRVEKRPDSDPESRHLVLAGGGTGTLERCVAYGMHEGQETVFHKPCQPDDAAQLIPARGMGLLYFNLHSAGKVATVQRGLKAEFFYGVQASTVDCTLPDVSMRQPDYVRVDAQLDYRQSNEWSGITEKDWLAGRWTGFLTIQHAGHYKFFLKVDDTVEILIDGKVLVHVGHCGWHRDVEASMDLPAGALPFVVHWMEATGGMALRVFYQGPDTKDQKVLIPTSAFSHVTDANTQLMVDASHSRGCIGNTGISRTKGSVFAPSEKATGVVCSFVPVVKTDEPVVLPTSRKRDGHWHEWWVELSDMDIECSEGKVLMSIDTEWVDEKMRVAYTCGVVAGLGYCTPSWSDQRDAQDWTPNNQQILDKLMVACPRGSLLNRLKFEYSIGGRWARFKTSCCATGGAPVGILRNGPDASRFDAMEGQYCPSGRGPSGRFVYQQRPIGPWQSIGAGHALQFDHNSGTWCIGPQCSDPVPLDPAAPGNAEPTSLALASLDVGPVSDFDGNFEAKGVGGAAGANGNKYLNGRLPKNPPKRPKPPKKPKLLVYEPEMPTYSDKCIQYGDLWKNLQETVVNDVGEETAEVSKLETEQEENAGYQDAHPCDVAGDAGGTSGTIGGGDGSDTRDQMPYDQLDGCHARDIERALVDGKETYWHDLYQTNTGLASSIVGAVCAVIPIGAIEPFGAGISMDFAGVCDGIQAAVADTIMSAPAIRQAKFYYDMAQDCNPLQTNFARLFCDIHCVRDAVVRGDRSIIRNLKQVTNKNLDQLSSWIAALLGEGFGVKSAQVDAGWLADKIDYAAAVNKRDFEKLMELLAGGDEKTTLVAIRAATESLLHALRRACRAFDDPDDPDQDSSAQQQAVLIIALGAGEVRFYVRFAAGRGWQYKSRAEGHPNMSPFLAGQPMGEDALDGKEGDYAHYPQELSDKLMLKKVTFVLLSGQKRQVEVGRLVIDYTFQAASFGTASALTARDALQRFADQALGVYKHFLNASNHVHDGKRSKGLLRAQHEVLVSLDKIWWSLRGKMDKYFDAADKEVKSFMRSLAMMQDYQQCHSGYTDLLATYKTTMRVSGRTHALLRDTWRECSNLVGELAATIGDSDAFTTFLAKEGCASSLALQTRRGAEVLRVAG